MVDCDTHADAAAAERASARTVVVALLANLAVAVAKAVVAATTGSTAVFAEAAHSFADSGNEILLLVAQRRSGRRPTADHPLGFGRDSYFWALLASIGVFLTGAVLSAREGVEHLLEPRDSTHVAAAYVVLSIAFALELVSFVRAYGQLKAEARVHGRDFIEHLVLTSDPTARAVLAEDAAALAGNTVAAFGLALHQATGSPVPESLAAIAVGVLLAGVGFQLAARNRDFLIGVQAPAPIRRRIRDALAAEPGIEDVGELIVTFVGPRRLWVIVHVRVDGGMRAPEIEALTRDVDRSLRGISPYIMRVDVVAAGVHAAGVVTECQQLDA